MSLIVNSLFSCDGIQVILAAFMLNLLRDNLYTMYYFCTNIIDMKENANGK